ncbi:hypothetical protein G6F21_014587 [Rhizopus arrhizus]|nr:hypothetical protein G6F21_014587 [Rhizopus arrhizus]KAG1059366.1 hypothetical protein G6F40_018140 [Rhizopus arrhizus]
MFRAGAGDACARSRPASLPRAARAATATARRGSRPAATGQPPNPRCASPAAARCVPTGLPSPATPRHQSARPRPSFHPAAPGRGRPRGSAARSPCR